MQHSCWPSEDDPRRFWSSPSRSGIFPNRDAVTRLVGAVLAEQHDDWIEGRRYLSLEVLARAAAVGTPPTQPAEAIGSELPELEPAA